jgi:hypothetical protein
VNIAEVMAAGTGDLNNHQVGVADVLTGGIALQQPGTYCTGGARTLDQELAVRGSAPGRFDSRVYGFDYIPNSVVSPFSYRVLGPRPAVPGARVPGGRDLPRLRAPVDPGQHGVRPDVQPTGRPGDDRPRRVARRAPGFLLAQLDSVAEGSGTLLDHTVVVWVTELATPTHQHFDVCTLLAWGCNGFFNTGRYVRYPRTFPNPWANAPMTGPPHNRLHVSLLQAMGQPDTSFGLTSAVAADGTALSFTGPLTELASSG